MKSLTEKQAKRCEEAKTPRCRCRCHGRYHGASRQRDIEIERDITQPLTREFFEALPADDPHHIPPKKEKARGNQP